MTVSYNFPLRIDDEVREKLRYLANKNCRSLNKEIEFVIRQYIENYEKEHGEIPLPKEE